MKLHLGCGNKILPGYINTDIEDWCGNVDQVLDAGDLSQFDDNVFDEVYSKSLIEHLSTDDIYKALKEWYRVLKPDGACIIDTPDLERVFKGWLVLKMIPENEALNNIYGPPPPRKYKARQHLTGFTFERLERMLLEVGFQKIKRLPNADRPYQILIVEGIK